MITFYQFPRLLGVPNMSPFCLKLETWLRMAELKYDIHEVADPRKAPKGKLPYINDDGTVIADTALIIDYLKKQYSVTLDQHLSVTDRAVAHAFGIMLEDHLYWALMYNRWVDENWPKVRDTFFSALPAVIKSVVPLMAQKNMKDALDGHGMGRHSRDEIYEMANQDLKAVADYLADKPYLMGDQPCTVDATLFSFLCNIVDVPLRSPMKEYLLKCDNLKRYKERIGLQLFPEFFRHEHEDEAWITAL